MPKSLLICAIAALLLVPSSASSAVDEPNRRVIVELVVAPGAGPEVISATTDALLALLPAGSYELTNRYNTLPYVGISANPVGLSIAQTSALVVAIHNDETVSASSSLEPAVVGGTTKQRCKKSRRSGGKRHRRTGTCKSTGH